MPTIQIKKRDLEDLLGRSATLTELAGYLPLVKGEIKGFDELTGELKLELNDTNRPDLWCVEGVARQIRTHLMKKAPSYSFYSHKGKTQPDSVVNVTPELKEVRPYIGACIARGLTIDQESLAQLIQTQEKLSDGFGRRRQLVSIGLYRMAKIAFPVSYTSSGGEEVKFVPLGYEEPMSLAEILERHPKGIEYRSVLAKAGRYPLLMDQKKRVLSFPPIINSRDIGEVRIGDRDLFVEVTGRDLRMVILTVNILAANLADRGAKIQPVEIRYPYNTEFGREVRMPTVLAESMEVSLDQITSCLGEKLPATEVGSALKMYGYQVRSVRGALSVSAPAYRDDLMHPVDVIEDVAISRGYDRFSPEMPSDFTVGGLSADERFSDRVRESLIGMGYQEIISNILTNREDSVERMNLASDEASAGLVCVENVMSQTYSALRDSIIPSLLRVEGVSSKSFYPHRIFEAGETAVIDEKAAEGTRTLLKLAALNSHASSSFSELHAHLDLLMYYLNKVYRLQSAPHPSFIEGRMGKILIDGEELGLIGELHPVVLGNWQVGMPCTVFELNLNLLMGRSSTP
jgi:phenylalanyl-tRNA synthetase beta chain